MPFFFNRTSFRDSAVISIETCRHPLLQRSIGKQVAGNLFDSKLIEWHVIVQRINNPITPTPHRPFEIVLISICVREPCRIKPTGREMFAKMR